MKLKMQKKNKNIKGTLLLFALIFMSSFFYIVKAEASKVENYNIFRVFELSNSSKEKNRNVGINLTPLDNIKKFLYEIETNSISNGDTYSTMFFLSVDKDFKNKFGKDIKVGQVGISGIGRKILSNVNIYNYIKDRKNDRKVYKGDFPYYLLDNGVNYIVFCATDIKSSVGEYVNLRCEGNPHIFYYISEYDKLVSKKEYLVYLKEVAKKQELKRQQELKYIENVNKYFDENKVKKSRFGSRSRIKTSKDLKKILFDYYQNSSTPITLKNLDKVVNNVADKFYTYDDNNKALSSFSGFQTYVKYLFKKFIYQKEHPEASQNTQNSNTTSTENTNTTQTTQNTNTNQYSSNNGDQALEEYKIKNANDRKRAIDFSKKLLKVLERYRTKDIKLQKIQEIRVILDTKFTPEKYSNQNLIGYVKDYLDIVEYAIQLQ